MSGWLALLPHDPVQLVLLGMPGLAVLMLFPLVLWLLVGRRLTPVVALAPSVFLLLVGGLIPTLYRFHQPVLSLPGFPNAELRLVHQMSYQGLALFGTAALMAASVALFAGISVHVRSAHTRLAPDRLWLPLLIPTGLVLAAAQAWWFPSGWPRASWSIPALLMVACGVLLAAARLPDNDAPDEIITRLAAWRLGAAVAGCLAVIALLVLRVEGMRAEYLGSFLFQPTSVSFLHPTPADAALGARLRWAPVEALLALALPGWALLSAHPARRSPLVRTTTWAGVGLLLVGLVGPIGRQVGAWSAMDESLYPASTLVYASIESRYPEVPSTNNAITIVQVKDGFTIGGQPVDVHDPEEVWDGMLTTWEALQSQGFVGADDRLALDVHGDTRLHTLRDVLHTAAWIDASYAEIEVLTQDRGCLRPMELHLAQAGRPGIALRHTPDGWLGPDDLPADTLLSAARGSDGLPAPILLIAGPDTTFQDIADVHTKATFAHHGFHVYVEVR